MNGAIVVPITPETRKTIPPRGLGKKTMIIRALEKRGLTPEDFWDEVIRLAMGGDESAGNIQLMQLLGQRLEAPFKPTMPPIDIGLEEGDTLEQMADKVISSDLPPDIAEKMLQNIKLRHEIGEKGDILKRLEALEGRNGGGTPKAD